MKITDLTAVELKPFGDLRWKEEWPARRMESVFVRVLSDEGSEGHCITYILPPGQFSAILPRLRETLVGRDPHDIEAISYELTDKLRDPTASASTIDIALWDLLGKLHNQPIYKLLGAARDRLRGYASTLMYDTIQEYVDLALECRQQGFTAFKLHAFGVPDKDIEVCRAVRQAVGDSMDLMIDPVNAYDRRGAFRVARVLEELNFYWFECPIPDTDFQGLKDLTRTFDIEIVAAESVRGGLLAYPPYLVEHALDALRPIGDQTGGITTMRKSAALAEAFGVKFEPHSYGCTSVTAAHFHVMLSTHNCDFLELPVPLGVLDQGMKDVIRVNPDGWVDAPTKPGLGYDVDLDAIDNLTVREL
jgi:L-alanine-DL-glutamate epimerase-like enolase superfamily enzyme